MSIFSSVHININRFHCSCINFSQHNMPIVMIQVCIPITQTAHTPMVTSLCLSFRARHDNQQVLATQYHQRLSCISITTVATNNWVTNNNTSKHKQRNRSNHCDQVQHIHCCNTIAKSKGLQTEYLIRG